MILKKKKIKNMKRKINNKILKLKKTLDNCYLMNLMNLKMPKINPGGSWRRSWKRSWRKSDNIESDHYVEPLGLKIEPRCDKKGDLKK